MTIGIVDGLPPRCVSRRFMSGVCSLNVPAFSASMKRLKSRANSPRRGSSSSTRGRLDRDGAGCEGSEETADPRGEAALLVLPRVVPADLDAANVGRRLELRDEVAERRER